MALLHVENLHTHFVSYDLDNRLRVARALNGVSLTVDAGEIVGLVGETGAGKSLTAMSVMGLLQPPAQIVEGQVLFGDKDLTQLETPALNRLRGNELCLIVQSPLTSLDPLARIGDQLVTAQLEHRRVSSSDARKKAIDTLRSVGIPDAERRMRSWPHELSGGMAQRVLIAMSLINDPRLIIADEPTTGLDVTVQAQILDLLHSLMRERNMASLLITHDLGVVAHYCHRMCVMFAGSIVEQGPVEVVFEDPKHPYTRALIASTPRNLTQRGYGVMGGIPPNLYDLPSGCHYRDRCPDAIDICAQEAPPRTEDSASRTVHCHRVETKEPAHA